MNDHPTPTRSLSDPIDPINKPMKGIVIGLIICIPIWAIIFAFVAL